MVNKHKPGSEQQKLVFPSEAQVLHKSNTQLSHARTSYHADLLSLQTWKLCEVWQTANNTWATSSVCFNATERLAVSGGAGGRVHLTSGHTELLSWSAQRIRHFQSRIELTSADVIIDICA